MSSPSGNLWQASSREAVEAPPLDGDTTADLVIVGGGFTGCAAALRAAELGARVVLIEAEGIGHGGSGRNVGLVNAGLWLPPSAIEAALGTGPGGRLVEALGRAPDLVFDLIARHGIDCEATRAGTLHLAHAPAGLRDLRDREAQQQARGAPVRLLSAAETAQRTGSTAWPGALHDARAGTVQPLAYNRGLARAAVAAGARLHAATPLSGLARDGGDWSLTTPRGRIRAPALLLATNAYHRAVPGLASPASVPVNYFQLATAPLPPELAATILPGGEGCWDTATVMASYRRDADGRLILGAIGSLGHPGAGLHRGWARRRLARVFPALAGLAWAHAWHGRIAMTGDHVPKVLDLGPRALAVFGYSGRGIGPGTVFGTAAAEALVAGRDDALPLAPVPAHAEPAAPLRALGIEAGALALHAVSDRL